MLNASILKLDCGNQHQPLIAHYLKLYSNENVTGLALVTI